MALNAGMELLATGAMTAGYLVLAGIVEERDPATGTVLATIKAGGHVGLDYFFDGRFYPHVAIVTANAEVAVVTEETLDGEMVPEVRRDRHRKVREALARQSLHQRRREERETRERAELEETLVALDLDRGTAETRAADAEAEAAVQAQYALDIERAAREQIFRLTQERDQAVHEADATRNTLTALQEQLAEQQKLLGRDLQERLTSIERAVRESRPPSDRSIQLTEIFLHHAEVLSSKLSPFRLLEALQPLIEELMASANDQVRNEAAQVYKALMIMRGHPGSAVTKN